VQQRGEENKKKKGSCEGGRKKGREKKLKNREVKIWQHLQRAGTPIDVDAIEGRLANSRANALRNRIHTHESRTSWLVLGLSVEAKSEARPSREIRIWAGMSLRLKLSQ